MTADYKGFVEAKITPEKIEALRARIGKERPVSLKDEFPFNTVCHEDTIRHFANGCGDDNPLFVDADYASNSRWKGMIAPPLYQSTLAKPDLLLKPGEKLPRQRDPMRGIHAFVSGTEMEFWQPVRVGDNLFKRSALHRVDEKRSEFGGGIAVHATTRVLLRNQRHEPVSAAYHLMIHTERESAASAGKYREHKRPQYTDEMVNEIDAAYANHYRRGGTPRYWEDVEEGEAMPPMVKGPLLILDLIGMHTGWGHGAPGIGPLRLGHLFRKRVPGFYIPNEWGWPDVIQRCHWDDGWAQATGNPYAYDYGFMRENWLAEFVVNWMGDDAWLWKLKVDIRRFNYIGDTTWFQGNVLRKYLADGGAPAVDLEFYGRNQDGEVTCPASATVLLPSRTRGLPALPLPPSDVVQIAAKGTEIVDAAAYSD